VPEPYNGPERRSEFRLWRESIDKRLDDGAHAMEGMRVDMDENTRATAEVKKDTAELVELLHSVKGAFKVLGWIGAAARPIGFIAAAAVACLGLWTASKGGHQIK
jgi:hypothetical protein